MATNKDFIVKNGLSVGEDISVSGSVTSNLQFDDSVQLQLGTDSDLLIYHDSNNSYIDDVGTGSLYIRSGTTYFQNAAGTKTSIQTNSGAGQTLYFNNSPIFATLVDGISVTGNAVLTGELRGPASFVIDPAAIGDNTGAVVIKGDLTVEGTTTTINSTTLTVDDKNIVLGSGSANAAAADGAGISVDITGVTNPEWNWYVNAVNTGVSGWESNYPVVITQTSTGRTTNLHLVNETSAASTEVALEMSVVAPSNDACDVRLVAHRRQSNAGSDFYIETTNSSNAIERHFTILEDGNVGIGINLPTVALDVSGDITATGTITGNAFSGINMGGSLTGTHTDAKVQYGNSFSGTPAQGHFFFDALNQKLKVYTGSAFVDAVPAGGGGGGGGGSSDATATFRKYTYTLASSTNAISGKEDDEVTTGAFISGRLYEITAVGDTDFTAIGASSNAIGVQFTSTGVGGGTTGKAKEVLFYTTGGTQNIEVYVNGVKAVEGSANDYVATTGTSVTFTSNLAVGDVVDIQVYELLTNDSYYLKTQTYTQAEVNTQITTGTSAYLPLAGGTLTGNITTSGTIKSDSAFGGFITLKRSDTTTTNNADIGAINFEHTDSDDAGVAATILTSGDGTAGGAKIRFYTGTPTTRQERLTILSNGNVGIGVVQPDDLLHINGNLRLENEGNAIIFETSSSGAAAEIKTGDTFGSNRLLIQGDNGIHNIIDSNSNGTGDWSVYNDNLSTHQLFVEGSTGKVGIGESSPFAKSHIKDVGWSTGAPYGTVQLIEGNNVTDNNWGHLVITDTTTSNGNGGAISFATGASTALNPFSGIKGVSEGTSWGGIGFYSRPQSGTATRRMTILSGGNVGIGTDSPTQKLEVAGTALVENAKLKAIVKSNTDTAVDVFVYDTRKDSDGGAWRKRTQNTSWYNEALNTATRGARKEFPCVAVIVAETTQVTIYDGDDPDMPMWMVFNVGSYYYLPPNRNMTCVSALNGYVMAGFDQSVAGLLLVDFVSENSRVYSSASSEYRDWAKPVSERNTGGASTAISNSAYAIVNDQVNDVVMTVLPNAPIDSATGLPVPTIAVATDAGVSVIKDDGNIYDLSGSNWAAVSYNVDFDQKGILYFSQRAYAAIGCDVKGLHQDYTSMIDGRNFFRAGLDAYPFFQAHGDDGNGWGHAYADYVTGSRDDFDLAHWSYYTHPFGRLVRHQTNHDLWNVYRGDSDLMNYTGPDYNTGWMHGDIKLATLSDTDTTNAVGTELISNSSSFSNTTGWYLDASNTSSGTIATIAASGNNLVFTHSNTNNSWDGFGTSGTFVVGKTYTIDTTIVSATNMNVLRITDSASQHDTDIQTTINSAGTHLFTFIATATTMYFHWNGYYTTSALTLSNFSVRLAEQDLSANNNGLQVIGGTVNKTVVATGAELVGYRSDGSSYLRQPSAGGLTLTSDFSITWWQKYDGSGGIYDGWQIVEDDISGASVYNKVVISAMHEVSSNQYLIRGANVTSSQVTNGIASGSWTCMTVTKTGSNISLYTNGKLSSTTTGTCATPSNPYSLEILRWSYATGYNYASNSDLALFRTSNTVPTPEQIKKIYEDEKFLFQENAKATLYGTSDAVTALAYDDDTQLLHVGTSAGRSVFQGLNRIDNTADAIGAAISASNGIVAEE